MAGLRSPAPSWRVAAGFLGVSVLAFAACDRAPVAGDGGPALDLGTYVPTDLIGDTQIACNVALEAVYARTDVVTPVAEMAADIWAQPPDGARHRCRIALAPAEDGTMGVRVFEVVVIQTGVDRFDVGGVDPLGLND
ncbi:MAG: hypothetical protein AAF253_09165 [Pseudomonadota bacterium]